MNTPNKPWSIQIEITYGCNRKCEFCYKQVLNKTKPEYMTTKVAEKAAKEIATFNPTRLKFALRGEPLLNPYWPDIINIFRTHLPDSKIILTTNGDLLTPKKVDEYYNQGGNVLLVDCYDNTINQRKRKYKHHNPIIQYEAGNTPYTLTPHTKELYLIEDLTHGDSNTRKLSNLAGNMTDAAMTKHNLHTTTPLKERCTRPFGEMTIHHNGSVGWCCLDGEANHSHWHINKGHLQDYWTTSTPLNNIRKELYNKNRNIPLCNQCSYFGGERTTTL